MVNSSCNGSFLQNLPSREYNYTFGGIMALISLFATFENGILLIVYIKFATVREPSTHKIILSMIVSDFLTGTLVGPLYAAQAIDENLLYDCDAGMVRVFLATMCLGTSVTTVGVISIERAMNLFKLQNNSIKGAFLYVIIAACWIVPITISITYFVKYYNIASIMMFVSGIMIFVITIISYLSLIIALQKHKSSSNNESLKTSYLRKQRAAAKTSIIILTCYTVMNLPLIIERIMLAMVPYYRRNIERPYVLMVVVLLMVGNSTINPIIYCARIPSIREHLVKLFCGKRTTRYIDPDQSVNAPARIRARTKLEQIHRIETKQ